MLMRPRTSVSPAKFTVSRAIAFVGSGAVHPALLATFALLAADTRDSTGGESGGGSSLFESGWRQLTGNRATRPAGRDALQDILSAPDGTMIRLTSDGAGDAVGLACWSPSIGLWLAIDRLPPRSGRSLRVWVREPDGGERPIGRIEVDETGSGRVIALWDTPEAPTRLVTLQVSASGTLWPFTRQAVVLQGSSVKAR
jgi:hypothetical protein